LQRGQYKNFEKLGIPPSDPIAKKHWLEFTLVRQQWLPVLRGEATPLQAEDANAPGGSQATSTKTKSADSSAPAAATAADPPSH
jgi:hypothetical protein